jgi:DNA-binding beta-propeller fold protein YncE
VTIIDTAKDEVITDLQVGNHPSKLITDDKGQFAYVINPGSDNLSIIDLKKFTVLTVPLGFSPSDLALSLKNRYLVILHQDPEQTSAGPELKGDYSIYDVKKEEVVATNFLNGIDATGNADVCGVVAPDKGDMAYITSCAANQVVAIKVKKAINSNSGDEVKDVFDTQDNPIFTAITGK